MGELKRERFSPKMISLKRIQTSLKQQALIELIVRQGSNSIQLRAGSVMYCVKRRCTMAHEANSRLQNLGGCSEQLTGPQEPINVLNVQDKEHLLTDLKPGSTYEVSWVVLVPDYGCQYEEFISSFCTFSHRPI